MKVYIKYKNEGKVFEQITNLLENTEKVRIKGTDDWIDFPEFEGWTAFSDEEGIFMISNEDILEMREVDLYAPSIN
jgi:hypothetical protein